MPPKKKQQQIDLASLPECKSTNIILHCKGKKGRASKIIQRIYKEAEKYMFKVQKSQVLNHAKQKNIYVDPSTLNDKQKKDAKFMESINTQLTASVVAKSVQSLISTLNVKIRIEKKNNINAFANQKRKYDVLYVFQDFPQARDQFEQIAKIGQGVRYVVVIQPKLNWANAPQLPQDQGQKNIEKENEEPEEQDEQIKEYRQLLKKQQKVQEDEQYQKQVNSKITKLKKLRSDSNTQSSFRNCTVSQLLVDIDPYNQQNSIQEIVNTFFESINKLDAQLVQFQEWKKDKKAEKMPEFDLKGENVKVKESTIIEMLNSVALRMGPEQAKKGELSNQQHQMLKLIDRLDYPVKREQENENFNNTQRKYNFFGGNQTMNATSKLQFDIRSNTRYPGIDRFQMPEIPAKSLEIRKKEQSEYSQFIGGKMSLQDFFRQVRILNFEQYIKQVDEERVYSFLDRIYEEHHNVDSLRRELYNATQFNQYTVHTKYDQNTDQLYLILLYKSNARRIGKKTWESNWKVIPNYQSWLKYFKNNENNLNSQHFYDLDYQKIGNIEETVKAYTLRSGETGAVVISKDYGVANKVQKLLYSIKNNLVFGVKNDRFFSSNREVKIYHDKLSSKESEQGEETIIVLPNSTIRVHSKSGNIILQNSEEVRMITPEGYTVVYQKQGSLILHPNGGITYSADTYINERGFGLKNGHLYRSQALLRTIDKGEIIKRDDGVVIVNDLGDKPSKWIKFGEGTEYKIENEVIKIQKKGQPFVTCQNNILRVYCDQFNIIVSPKAGYYGTLIQFKDFSRLKLDKNVVTVYQEGEVQSIQVDITQNSIKSSFNQQQLLIKRESSQYRCKNKILNPLQDQQKFNEQESIAADFIQPRLFIINNDNTGIELISQKNLDLYLKQHSATIHKVYEQPLGNKQQIHIVNKFQTNHTKFITNELQVNLDVFNNTVPDTQSETESQIVIKTLIKYPAFTQEGVNNINSIKQNHQIWKKAKVKQENQFGFRARDEQITKAKIAQKILMIKTRKAKPNIIDSEKLKENGKSLFLKSQYQNQSKIEKEMKEAQLRKQYSKKRDSVVQQYKPIPYSNQRVKKENQPQQQPLEFLDHYFLTDEGKKALSEMPQWVFRPKQKKQIPELDPQIQNQLKNTNFNKEQENSQDRRERYDTVQVNLNPKREKQIYIKPSVFTQRDIDDERRAFEQQKKAYKYHEAKRKDFGLYGQQRKVMPEVKTLLRSQAISEINQKYLVTEAPLDKKVKISSMKNKLTSSACNMTEMRKQGPHSLLIKTLDKGNDINKLLQKRTMMVQADLNDKLQRDILINPVQVNFGVIMQRKTYEFKIEIKNQDVISQRITLKRPKNTHVKVALSEMGPIAMGMTRKIIVTIQASPEILGKFADQFDIVTKHQIYHIPITAHIVSESQVKTETLLLSRGVVQVNEYKKKSQATLQLPRIK